MDGEAVRGAGNGVVFGSTCGLSPIPQPRRLDVRKITVGDCALFKPPQDSPPFIGIIRSLASDKDNNLKLEVNWLYRPGEVKLGKDVAVEAAPNEVFYSFHRDEISAASLLHLCKVAFLPKGVVLPAGVSSFVCRRVYDITNKRFWWLTDRDYTNDRQDEVNQLLNKTRLELYSSAQQQQGVRSPKPMSGPTSTSQMKHSPETMQTSTGSFPSQSKGRKRERSDQGSEPVKRERVSRSDDGDVGQLKADSVLKSEIAKITERGGLVNFEGVERLIQLMQPENTEKKLDWPSRSLLAGVIAATDRFDCLSRFVQLKGLVVLDEWLQEIHKSKIGDSSSPKDSDKSVEEFLLVLLRALDKLPVNLNALQTCNIGKSVNHLRSNRNSEIQKKARSLVDTWKKRVEAEMNITDAKSGSGQAVPWNARSRPEVSHGGNRQAGGSSDVVLRSSVTQISSSKSASIKLVQPESNGKPSAASPAPSKTSLPASPTANFKDGQPRTSVTGANPEIPQAAARDDRSSSSSQSHTNSQCSSEHGKNFAPSGKEDARSSTAGSTSACKVTGSASRQRRSPNDLHGASASVVQREGISSRNSTKISAPEKSSPSPLTSQKTNDTPAAEGNNHKLIVKIPNRGRSPAQSVVGGSMDDPTCTSSRVSSPVHSEKNEQFGQAVKDNVDAFRTAVGSEINTESWQSNDLKDVVSDEGDGSPAVVTDSDRRQTVDDSAKRGDIKPRKSLQPSFSPMNALMESCAKYSGASGNALAIDDVGMNLLASVAAGESGMATPSGSPPNMAEEPCTDYNGTAQVNEDDPSSHSSTSGKDFTPNEESCLKSNGKANDSIGPSAEPTTGGEELKGRKTSKDEILNTASTRQNMDNGCKDLLSLKEDTLKTTAEVSSSRFDDEKKFVHQLVNSNALGGHTASEVVVSYPESAVNHEDAGLMPGANKTSLPENNMKTGDENARFHADRERTVTHDQENGTSVTLKSPDEWWPNTGLVATERKITSSVENQSSKVAFVNGFGRQSFQKESNVIVETESPAKTLGPKSEAVEGTVLDQRMPSGAASASSDSSDADGKLGFDLNEGLNVDDGKWAEPVSAPPGFSQSIFLGSLPAFSVPSTSVALPASVTVAAAAKGSFFPPEDLMRNKGELGWKGSAATSAFRPAEPRKASEPALGTGGVPVSSAPSSKPARAPLEFDLNVADDMVLEDMGCQVPTPGKSDAKSSSSFFSSGQAGTASVPRSGGLDLDLNTMDEAPELGLQSNIHRYEAPLQPARPALSSGFTHSDASSRRNFDLNGPGVDESVAEPSLHNQARANFPMQLPLRINNADMISLSSWYPPGNSYSAVPIPSLMTDRGDQPFPVVGANGIPQRISSGPTGNTPFNMDAYRGPVLSSSTAMPFPSTPFQYPVFPFGTTFPLASSTFSGGSAAYMDMSSGGRLCIAAVPSQLMGSGGAVPSQYPRPYMVSLPDVGNGVVDSSWKFGRQGLDLNAGPGVPPDVEGRDETTPTLSRQVLSSNSMGLSEEQARMFHVVGGVLRRKEPDSGWDGDRVVEDWLMVTSCDKLLAGGGEQAMMGTGARTCKPLKLKLFCISVPDEFLVYLTNGGGGGVVSELMHL
ncbi:ASI1-immunoprecipitated protein 3-like protein [Drosera capensis]